MRKTSLADNTHGDGLGVNPLLEEPVDRDSVDDSQGYHDNAPVYQPTLAQNLMLEYDHVNRLWRLQ